MVHPGSIVILDFGGQYAHLIASRVRRFGVFSEIRESDVPLEELEGAAGIILSGGPQSVNEKGAPQADPRIFELGIPVLGICYGLHWLTQTLGGTVEPGKIKEYGHTKIEPVGEGGILKDLTGIVWMSHGDETTEIPPGFEMIATSEACKYAAFEDPNRQIYAVQFHPEVTHTQNGLEILKRFVEKCEATEWSVSGYHERIKEELKAKVGDDKKVFILVSGGVDSTVAFTLLNEVLGSDRVFGLLVDHGLMRLNEAKKVEVAFKELKIDNLHIEDASELFFSKLKGVTDPEEKRLIIGQTFLEVQKQVAERLGLDGPEWMLGQGTIYPDTIETGSTKHADQIKTHHNVIPAIQKLHEQGLVIEPLRDLYKDEVRELGEELGLPHDLVWRHPFPGPGLGVRILCQAEEPESLDLDIKTPYTVLPVKSVGVQGDGRTYRQALAIFSDSPTELNEEFISLATQVPNKNPQISRVLKCLSQSEVPELVAQSSEVNRERADLLRQADNIVEEEMRAGDCYEAIWQFPVVLLPFGTSEGGQSVVLRPIDSIDAMTAQAYILPPEVITKMTERIAVLPGVDLVFYDLTNKPPGTIEWE